MLRSQLEYGDLLIAIVGATIGSVGVYKQRSPANINQAIAAVRISDERLSSDFVCWFLKSSLGQAELDYLKRPVARANINLDEISQILIPIPPKEMQEQILAKVQRGRELAQTLQSKATHVWHTAKVEFEKALLGK